MLNNFIHSYQLGGLKQRSTSDADVILTHFIHSGQVKNNITSILVFNIVQFFPLLNYHLLIILRKAIYDSKVNCLFSNYLVGRKTQYYWNNISSSLFDVDVRVEQGLALSAISSVLYIAFVFHILENCLKILKIPVSIFVVATTYHSRTNDLTTSKALQWVIK